jgi:ATP-dependent DNA helicase RecQ
MMIINTFEQTNLRKFQTEFRNYLNEIKIEELYHPDKNFILVSTMHKAKGKEFENVFLLLEDFKLKKAEQQRVVYVAMTRAKTNLFIYTNQNYFNGIKTENLIFENDQAKYEPPGSLYRQTNLENIQLGIYIHNYHIDKVKNLFAGEPLTLKNWEILDKGGNSLLFFSKAFKEELEKIFQKGYQVKEISIGYIVVWFDKEEGKEYRVVLPKIIFEKVRIPDLANYPLTQPEQLP